MPKRNQTQSDPCGPRMKPDQKLRGFSLVDEEIPHPRSKEDRLLCLERGTSGHRIPWQTDEDRFIAWPFRCKVGFKGFLQHPTFWQRRVVTKILEVCFSLGFHSVLDVRDNRPVTKFGKLKETQCNFCVRPQW